MTTRKPTAVEIKRVKLLIALVGVSLFGLLLVIVIIIGNSSSMEYDSETIQSEARLEAVPVTVTTVNNNVESNDTATMQVVVVDALGDVAGVVYDSFLPVLLLVAVAGFIGGLINALFKIEKYR